MSDQKSLWMRADELRQRVLQIADATQLIEAVAELAALVRDHCELTGLAAEGLPPLEEGVEYELLLRVRALATEVDADTQSYELQLDHKDFFGGRVVAIDHAEIVGARRTRS